MKTIYSQLKEKTDLEQFYGQAQNLPPLLICNPNSNTNYIGTLSLYGKSNKIVCTCK